MVFNLRTFSSPESVENDPTPPKSFSLKELRRATDNFSSKNIVGSNSGAKVYKGRLADGSLVTVNRASYVNRSSKKEFEAEVQVGSTVSTHTNVLRLRGFCRTKKELLLVYTLMINKNLFHTLRERPDRFARPLDWTTRKRIALGAARGLAHLHNQGNIKILHRDICPINILLNVHFEAVIGGFSLAVIMHENNAEEGTIKWPTRSSDSGSDSQSYHRCEDVYVDTTAVCGTYGFIAPEYLLTGKCTVKNDVYAYGKMLLELMSGTGISELISLAVDEDLSLEEWIGDLKNKNELGRVIDPNLQGNYVEEEAERLVGFALLCSHADPSIRPEMSEVVRMLESQFLQRDPSTKSSWSQSEGDSTPYYSFPPSPSPLGIAPECAEILISAEESSPDGQYSGKNIQYEKTECAEILISASNNSADDGRVEPERTEQPSTSDQETQLQFVTASGASQEEDRTEPKVARKFSQGAVKIWSNLKKVILLKRFVKASEKVRNLNLQKPQYLPPQTDDEPEKVNLRHQDMDGRKNTEEWMLDYALQQVVSRLTPTRRRKVHLLVEAFKMVSPPVGK